MMRRERLQRALKEHGAWLYLPPTTPLTASFQAHLEDKFLDALDTACGPEPRREDLRAILKRWWNPPDEAEARIWAWATGATEPRWCEHWKHDGRFWEPMNQEGVTAVAQNHWRVCPLCATPRPAGA